jgi:hypothetical protein
LKGISAKKPKRIYLSSSFLANRFRVNKDSVTLAYSLTLGVKVPDYEVEKKFWPNRHYEGQYLFRDSVVLEMKPPQSDGDTWQVLYDWQSDNVGQSSTEISIKALRGSGGKLEVVIPFFTGDRTPPRSPGIVGQLRFVISEWNV